MKLGLLTAAFPDLTLEEVADWASANEFETLEIACWPKAGADARRYAGTSHIDVANLTQAQATDLVGQITARGLAISGLGYYPNPLNPDPEHRARVGLPEPEVRGHHRQHRPVGTRVGSRDGARHDRDGQRDKSEQAADHHHPEESAEAPAHGR